MCLAAGVSGVSSMRSAFGSVQRDMTLCWSAGPAGKSCKSMCALVVNPIMRFLTMFTVYLLQHMIITLAVAVWVSVCVCVFVCSLCIKVKTITPSC